MSRLKDQIIGQEIIFWNKATDLIGGCQTLPEFLKETKKIAPNFMMNSPSSTAELTEELEEGYNQFWENKNA